MPFGVDHAPSPPCLLIDPCHSSREIEGPHEPDDPARLIVELIRRPQEHDGDCIPRGVKHAEEVRELVREDRIGWREIFDRGDFIAACHHGDEPAEQPGSTIGEPLTLIDESHHHIRLSDRNVRGQLGEQAPLAPRHSRCPWDDVENHETDLEAPLIDGRHRGHRGSQIRLPVRLSPVRIIGGDAHGHGTEVGRLSVHGLARAGTDREEDRRRKEGGRPNERPPSAREYPPTGLRRTRWTHTLPRFLDAACRL
jgi:hypothetical protein